MTYIVLIEDSFLTLRFLDIVRVQLETNFVAKFSVTGAFHQLRGHLVTKRISIDDILTNWLDWSAIDEIRVFNGNDDGLARRRIRLIDRKRVSWIRHSDRGYKRIDRKIRGEKCGMRGNTAVLEDGTMQVGNHQLMDTNAQEIGNLC